MDLSQRLLSFLGKSEGDPDFQAFLLEMKERFEARLTVSCSDSETPIQGYYFDKLGFWLHIEPRWGYINDVNFSVSGTETGQMQPFPESLPAGISFKDNRNEIRRKLGNPARSDTFPGKDGNVQMDTYLIAPFVYRVSFKEPEPGLVWLKVIFAGRGLADRYGGARSG